MRKSLTIGGALLALAAFASTADARMMGGGGGMGMSMSHGAPISSSMSSSSMSSSIGSPRGFSPDGRTFSASGRTFSPDGFQTRVKGSNWKKPIDSDNGGDDPQPKPPKTQTGDSGGGSHYGGPYGGHYGGWPPHHGGGYYGPYDGNRNSGNVPQRDCRGC